MPKARLFNLIHALSGSEKKFFHQYATRHIQDRAPVYLQIFDAIENQKIYDERQLKDQFKNIASLKNFHNVKAYLHDLILQSLVILHSEQSAYRKVLQKLSSAEILCEKLLFDDALTQLEDVMKLAEEYEFTELALLACRWDEIIFTASHLISHPGVNIGDKYGMKKNLIRRIDSLTEFRQLYLLASRHDWSNAPPGSEAHGTIMKIFDNPLLEDKNIPTEKGERRFYYGLRFIRAKTSGKKKEALREVQKLVALLEQFPQKFYYNKYVLLYAYFFCIHECIASRKWSLAEKMITRFRNLHVSSAQNKYFRHHLLFAAELNYFIGSNQPGCSLALINDFERTLHQYQKSINRRVEFMNYQNIMNHLVRMKQYEKASYFINKILNEESPEAEDLPYYIHAKLLRLIVLYETEEFDLLDPLIRQTEYYFTTHDIHFRFMKELCKFLKKTQKPSSNPKQKFFELEKTFKELIKDPVEKNPLKSFLSCGWLENHGIVIKD